ncbi:methylmalonyl Co-A mutase-associated GTPase MeaB [Nocardioides immobilis]|uniref:Methylmalonyl Co-A mutase-associated GTPase MeaB n=1 Tax=Nocardioides immobilis TaxID=2049295 RepID=A0A417Y1D4_9ACTN|nr:methylmalonyl Co-A mutase-associated GTPase MeaB [Nocardioides immobilis]
MLAGERDARSARTLGRLLTALEESPIGAGASILTTISRGLRAHVIALTGAPGVGKSTLTAALVKEVRARGRSVGVLAVDPSSPRTGGALLGDRVRMSGFELDRDVFIRSMSSRGALGGLSAATPSAVRALDAAGFETVIIETVGVGQSEVDVCAIADSTVLVAAPGMGDDVQASKAGIVELVDIFAVNKADQPGAVAARRHLRLASADRDVRAGQWRPPVLLTCGATGEGVGPLLDSLEAHQVYLRTSGELDQRRAERFEREMELFAHGMVRAKLQAWREDGRLTGAVRDIAQGSLDPAAAALLLMQG